MQTIIFILKHCSQIYVLGPMVTECQFIFYLCCRIEVLLSEEILDLQTKARHYLIPPPLYHLKTITVICFEGIFINYWKWKRTHLAGQILL